MYNKSFSKTGEHLEILQSSQNSKKIINKQKQIATYMHMHNYTYAYCMVYMYFYSHAYTGYVYLSTTQVL